MTGTEFLAPTTPPEQGCVRVLDGAGAAGKIVGGKAAALDRLIGWGVRVPPAACVTADAYRVVAAEPPVGALLARLERGEVVAATEVDAVFRRAGLPGALLDEVCAVAAGLADGRPVAVRSSATVEDMDSSSFAGQYHSVLDVDPADRAAVAHAVLSVFSSLHHPAPRAYRRALGLADDDVAMAALIMPMVAALRSGVLFTQDPTGPAATVRIETVHGLAEGLVSGKRTPAVLLVPGGAVPDDSAEEIEPLITVAREIERRAGCPQDVEWAWDGSTLWIVQARPITVLTTDRDPFDTDAEEMTGHHFTTAGIAEMLPGVLPPLRWEVCSFVVEEALRTMFDVLGTTTPDGMASPHRLLRRVQGRAALDTAAAEAAAAHPTGRIDALGHHVRAGRARRRAVFDADVVITAAREIGREATSLSARSGAELARYQLALIDLMTRAMAAEITVAADAGAIHEGLRQLLRRFGPDSEADRLAGALTVPETVITVDSRASMAVPGGPTWIESGREPSVVTQHRAQPVGVDAAMKLIEASPRRPKTDITRWLRLRQLERLVTEARAQFERRERTKAAILSLGGELRRVHLEVGRRSAADGVLACAADVELLTVGEFRALSVGHPPPVPAILDRRRRRLRRQEQLDPLPQTFSGEDESAGSTATLHGRQLTGWAAGNGTFRGTGRRLTTPDEPLGSDEILLATTTDPSWAPLLMRCGAMVIEQGGPLSHAAILAREFGVPAVFNLPGAARALDGHRLEVDGTAGTVTILDEGRSDDLARA
ncbi:PEP/pyruvate-binding domain-containing protein [Nocardia ignorata]|uniref:PEP/pyruvate-binding domain-containing protein n=1 Tax=Nocardia ignorata TaxID=145285 RepID=UPI0036405E8C